MNVLILLHIINMKQVTVIISKNEKNVWIRLTERIQILYKIKYSYPQTMFTPAPEQLYTIYKLNNIAS